MNVWDIVILAVIALAAGLAARKLVRDRKRGKCSCGCETCTCVCDKRKG